MTFAKTGITVNEIMYNGSVGRLHGKYCLAHNPQAFAVLLLHPHPLHGGSMDNKVVYNMFHEFVKKGMTVLRFNFRGVGKSEGKYSGVEEIYDAAISMDKLINLAPEAAQYWVAGFSFGASIALNLLLRRPEISNFVLVSPPARQEVVLFPCQADGLFIQGVEDEIVSEDDTYNLYLKVAKLKGSTVEYVPISGADHFFTKHMTEFRDTLGTYVDHKIQEFKKQEESRF